MSVGVAVAMPIVTKMIGLNLEPINGCSQWRQPLIGAPVNGSTEVYDWQSNVLKTVELCLALTVLNVLH